MTLLAIFSFPICGMLAALAELGLYLLWTWSPERQAMRCSTEAPR